MHYFLLPGNPPALYFYEVWAEEIRERDPSVRVAVAHYPLSVDRGDSQAFFGRLVDQITDQFLDFRARIRAGNGGPVSLVGHSLGGYLALKVLARIPVEVDGAYLVHPFLRRPAPSGRALLRLAYELRRVPALERWLARAQPVIGFFHANAHRLTAEEIHLFTELAHHEHLTIAQDPSPPEIDPELRTKLRVYTTPGDRWCPPESIALLGPGVRQVNGPASHDFVVRRADRDLISEFIR